MNEKQQPELIGNDLYTLILRVIINYLGKYVASQITSQPHVCLLNRLFDAQIKESIKAPRQWPLWEVFTSDRWILHTKGQ